MTNAGTVTGSTRSRNEQARSATHAGSLPPPNPMKSLFESLLSYVHKNRTPIVANRAAAIRTVHQTGVLPRDAARAAWRFSVSMALRSDLSCFGLFGSHARNCVRAQNEVIGGRGGGAGGGVGGGGGGQERAGWGGGILLARARLAATPSGDFTA